MSNARKESKKRMDKIHSENCSHLRSIYKIHNYNTNSRYESLMRNNQQAIDGFNEAEKNLQKAVVAFEQARRNFALAVGMPRRYLENFYIDNSKADFYNIYFGGYNRPLGKSHGHYVVNRFGEVTYKREVNSPHGVKNYCRPSVNSTCANSSAI